MKRVLLVVGSILLPLGFFYLVLAGSVWAVEMGQGEGACQDCVPAVHVKAGETAAVGGGGPSIDFNKTVDQDPNSCGPNGQITLPPGGGTVYYCYYVENTGDVTLTMHTVIDDKLGTLLGPGFPVNLTPGAIGYFTIEVNITQTTANSATWRAFNPGPADVVTGTDTALVIVKGPILALTATNDGPTALGRETTLATVISGGGNETYTWDFGDGDFGKGAVMTHVYPSLGVYTAVVTATNSFNSLTASTVVTVIHPPVYMPAVLRP